MKKNLVVAMAFGFSLVILVISLRTLTGISAQAAISITSPQAPGDCEVTTTADSGPGSLRQCILDLQAGGTITFNTSVFPPNSPMTISPVSAFPGITSDNVTIDGSNAGVVLDGSGLSSEANGLTIDGASMVVIQGLYIFNFPAHGIALWNGAKNNTIGGDTPDERNVINGNGAVNDWGCGIYISGNGTMSNTVSGNYIGTNISGTAVLGNEADGVWIGEGAQYNTIGGDTESERNLISGNGNTGVNLNGIGTMYNTVSGNYIGIDVNGTGALGNDIGGVDISDGASYTAIGGDTPGERNVISGNGTVGDWGYGVNINGTGTMFNIVSGNYIGIDASGIYAVNNGGHGVDINAGASNNIIGGDMPGERNVISSNGNTLDGGGGGVNISGSGTMSNTVSGNYIGTDVSGTNALGNKGNGVSVANGAMYSTIGGQTTSDGNLISDNKEGGVLVWKSNYNVVSGNRIGTDVSGTIDLGNAYQGITVASNSSHNRVQNNVVTGSRGGGGGVLVAYSDALQNTITQNSIYSNVRRGIDLWLGGNLELFPPLLTTVSDHMVAGIAVPDATVEIFSDDEDEGRWFHGATTADSTGHFTFTTSIPFTGTNVTATATDIDGNTSEFSSPHTPNRDVVVAAVYVPQQQQQIDVPLTPLVRVGNGGTAPETFTVTTVITHAGARVYEDQQIVADLAMLHYRTISFTPWTPTVLGDYTFEVIVHPETPDDDPSNDRLALNFSGVDDRVDLWSRDNPTDDGQEPSIGPAWQSLDLWVRNTADGLPEPQDPINNITNTLYVLVRNRGTITATGATVSVYWHPPALVIGQPWWGAIGTVSVGEIAPGAVHTVTMDWRPQITGVLTEPYHTCLIDVISSTQEPAPEQWDVQSSNNIAQRNVNIISPPTMTALNAAASTPVSMTFSIGNPYATEQLVDVIVDATGVPDGGEIRLDLGPLFERWQHLGQGSLTGAIEVSGTTQITMPGGIIATINRLPLTRWEQVEVVMVVAGLNGQHGEINVSERIGDDILGGISLSVIGRFDIFLPIVLRDFSP